MKKRYFSIILVVALLLASLPCNVSAKTKREKALEAYQKFLGKYESSYTIRDFDYENENKENYNSCSAFMLKDMNGDKVPELVTLHPIRYKDYKVYIYTYKKGKVCQLNKKAISCTSVSGGSAYVYFCSRNHLHNHYLYGLFEEDDTAYKLNTKGKLSKYLDYQESFITNKIVCKKNGKKISQKKYNSLIKKCKAQDDAWRTNNQTERDQLIR